MGHIEAALAGYLKPYFPEALEIEGVDLALPLSGKEPKIDVTVYLRQKPKEQLDLPFEVANDNNKVVDFKTAKKVNNKRKS